MPETVYTSTARIDHLGVPYNQALLPAESEPVLFGVHGGIAEHYRITPDMATPRAATLDYIVASAGGMPLISGSYNQQKRRCDMNRNVIVVMAAVLMFMVVPAFSADTIDHQKQYQCQVEARKCMDDLSDAQAKMTAIPAAPVTREKQDHFEIMFLNNSLMHSLNSD